MSPFDAGGAGPMAADRESLPVSYRVDRDSGRVTRTVVGQIRRYTSSVPLLRGAPHRDPESAFDWCWLRRMKPPRGRPSGRIVRAVDLFSGCGQMSVGAREAARAVGAGFQLAMAHDWEPDASEVCRRIFPSGLVRTVDIADLLDGEVGAAPTSAERRLRGELGRVDLLVGGPPCQGHSDLNNHTRRDDCRNRLALRMVRMAELVEPRVIMIENVRGVLHDRGGVLGHVESLLHKRGYTTARRVMRAERLGVPQRRHRLLLVAALGSADLKWTLDIPERAARPFSWACGDLDGIEPWSDHDRAPVPNATNRARIATLFREGTHDLRNRHRPKCHRDGNHTYNSVYGRLWWDRPAQTITTGFRCMGQGRFVHPRRERTITPHEAARLQFIPDFVGFDGLRPTSVARLIGNAVPPKLAFEVLVRLLVHAGLEGT